MKHDLVNLRVYHHKLDNYRSSWSAPNAADAIQRALRPDDVWVEDFSSKYSETGSLEESRNYADRFMPGGSEFNSEDFEAALNASINNTDYAGTNSSVVTGSQAVDYSSYTNGDLDFDLSSLLARPRIHAGLSYRRYNISSGGSFYNDGPLGFGEDIQIDQYGGYVQLSDAFLDNSLKVTAGLRLDGHSEYETSFSPRILAVYSLGENQNQHIRASFQTGFRYPSIQEGFFRLQLTSAFTVIGSAQRSIDNFIHRGRTGNEFTLNEIIAEDGRGFTAVQPERNTTYELGYKALLGKKLLVDLNYYFTEYENFINRPVIVFRPGTPDFQLFAIRQNRDETVQSQGAGLMAEYIFTEKFKLGIQYDWNKFDSPDYQGDDKDSFLRSLQFNTPEHRAGITLEASKLGADKRWSFQFSSYFSSSFDFFSNFGENIMDEVNYSNASIGYRFSDDWSLKLGGSNIFKQEYSYVYGGPQIGALYYLSLSFH